MTASRWTQPVSLGRVDLNRLRIVSHVECPGLQCKPLLTVYCPTSAHADNNESWPAGRRGIVLEGQQDTVPLEAE